MDNAAEPDEFAMTIMCSHALAADLTSPGAAGMTGCGAPLSANVHSPAERGCIKLLTLAEFSKIRQEVLHK
jgi:hypothetical protein